MGELWRGVVAFAPEGTDPRGGGAMIEMGRKVKGGDFDEEGTMQVGRVGRTYEAGRQVITVRQIRLQHGSFANSPH